MLGMSLAVGSRYTISSMTDNNVKFTGVIERAIPLTPERRLCPCVVVSEATFKPDDWNFTEEETGNTVLNPVKYKVYTIASKKNPRVMSVVGTYTGRVHPKFNERNVTCPCYDFTSVSLRRESWSFAPMDPKYTDNIGSRDANEEYAPEKSNATRDTLMNYLLEKGVAEGSATVDMILGALAPSWQDETLLELKKQVFNGDYVDTKFRYAVGKSDIQMWQELKERIDARRMFNQIKPLADRWVATVRDRMAKPHNTGLFPKSVNPGDFAFLNNLIKNISDARNVEELNTALLEVFGLKNQEKIGEQLKKYSRLQRIFKIPLKKADGAAPFEGSADFDYYLGQLIQTRSQYGGRRRRRTLKLKGKQRSTRRR